MHAFTRTGRFFPFGFTYPASLCKRTARILLMLASVLLAALPFTQHLWTWDRFLQGGHDFETNALLILCALCLLLVLVRHCQQGTRLLLVRLARLNPTVKGRADRRLRGTRFHVHEKAKSRCLGPFSLPLRI